MVPRLWRSGASLREKTREFAYPSRRIEGLDRRTIAEQEKVVNYSSQNSISTDVILENQDVLMTVAGFLSVWKVEVQQLGHPLSLDLPANRAMKLGATGRKGAKETALNDGIDIGFSSTMLVVAVSPR